ncbi:MAG: ATP synthase F1 subunit delta [Selenomonadaceae bacterium]|nr:ATP synthase F1 subunit delta [Selenomonadaceae bacterium]
MLNIQLASKYAAAIFEIAKEEKNLDGYDKDLARVRTDVFSIPDAVKFFQNPLIPQQAKKDLLKRALDKEISATVMNFLMLLVDKKRIGVFNEIYDIFTSLKNKEQGVLIADVTSAFPLSKKQQDALIKKLASLTGRKADKVKIRIHKDTSILGGLILKIGDKRIDGSAAGRLRALQTAMRN